MSNLKGNTVTIGNPGCTVKDSPTTPYRQQWASIVRTCIEKGHGIVRLEVIKDQAKVWLKSESNGDEELLEEVSPKMAHSLARVLFNVICIERDYTYSPAKHALGSFQAYYGDKVIKATCNSIPLESVFGESFEVTVTCN